MPIHRATGPRGGRGWQYGESGKVYPTRKQALKQAIAIIKYNSLNIFQCIHYLTY